MKRFKNWLEGGAVALVQTTAVCVLFVGVPAPKAEAVPVFHPSPYGGGPYYGYTNSTCSGSPVKKAIYLTTLSEAGASYYTKGAPKKRDPNIACTTIPDFNGAACKTAVAQAINVSAISIMFIYPMVGGVLLAVINSPMANEEGAWTSIVMEVSESVCMP